MFFLPIIAEAATPAVQTESSAKSTLRWWRGNLHTHTLWSDGDDYPEMVVEWYKKHGYHFLALSDHNILSQGQRWIDVAKSKGRLKAFDRYRQRFSDDRVEQRIVDGKLQVRLKPLSEFRYLFEEPDRFLLIQAEEISGKAHVSAINLRELIPPQRGSSIAEILQNNINAVQEQRKKTGQAMFPIVNHPNFRWRLTAEDIMYLKGGKFFEVYNGIPNTNNYGDGKHASTERIWDTILTKRLAELRLPIMYGIATDDAHDYHRYGQLSANPGRGWVMVRTCNLTPESIIKAMEAGDFYASTGVVLKDIQFDGEALKVEIQPEKGVSYTTQFIGTLKGYDPTSKPVWDDNGNEIRTTRIYSNDIGKVLAEVKGAVASYILTSDEIYVRAKVTSTKLKENPHVGREVEVAWAQPVVPNKK